MKIEKEETFEELESKVRTGSLPSSPINDQAKPKLTAGFQMKGAKEREVKYNWANARRSSIATSTLPGVTPTAKKTNDAVDLPIPTEKSKIKRQEVSRVASFNLTFGGALSFNNPPAVPQQTAKSIPLPVNLSRYIWFALRSLSSF